MLSAQCRPSRDVVTRTREAEAEARREEAKNRGNVEPWNRVEPCRAVEPILLPRILLVPY